MARVRVDVYLLICVFPLLVLMGCGLVPALGTPTRVGKPMNPVVSEPTPNDTEAAPPPTATATATAAAVDATEEAAATVTATASPPPDAAAGCWNVPAYPGSRSATVDDIRTQAVRSLAEGYIASEETHLWVTEDGYEAVDAYYADTMTLLGWHQWMDLSSPYLGGGHSWQLDERGQNTIFVWTHPDEGQTVIAMLCIRE